MTMDQNVRKKFRTFCCCIPVRAGVIIIAILGILGGALLATMGGIGLTRTVVTEANRIASGTQVAVYSILALVSVLGLIGAIGKKRGLIQLYFVILVGHLLFSFVLGVYGLHRIFKDSPQYLGQCLGDSQDESILKVCKEGDMLVKGLAVGFSLVAWLLEIWGCMIVSSYSKQLAEEAETESVVKDDSAW